MQVLFKIILTRFTAKFSDFYDCGIVNNTKLNIQTNDTNIKEKRSVANKQI